MKILEKIKGITGDLIYSVLGLVAMNGVIQLVLYPFFNSSLGSEQFGNVLTMISLVSIMGSTFGTAANYSRMVSHTKGTDSNGDYNIFLLIIAAVSVVVSLAGVLWLGEGSIVYFIGYYLLMVVTVMRYYGDVEFRLNVNYKRFLIYYLLISAGYLIGIVCFKFTNSWILAMLMGEMLAVAYVIATGSIFRKPLLKPSENFKANFVSFALLSGTELIATLILNADRIMLQAFAGGTAVTVFYAATLIGKMVSLVSMPLNGVIIGHLARYDGKLKDSTFVKLCGGSILLSLVLNVLCVGVSYIFVGIMYADIFEMVKPYFWLANLGQVFYFVSNTLTVILLRFTDEKYQLYINLIYLAVFVALAVPMTYVWQLWGMAWALVIVNVIKILVVAVVGKIQLGRIAKSQK